MVSAYTLCLKNTSVEASNLKELLVVIDAGHGGRDGGVTGVRTGVKESDLNLKIAFDLKETLEDAGFQVVMTRSTQFGVTEGANKWSKREDMRLRKQIIQQTAPSLVVSVHQNFYPTKAPRGAQVFYLKESETSKNLAACVQEKLNNLYEKDGVKPRVITPSNYYVLKCASVPSIIVECGFLSNPKDDELLAKESYRKEIAKYIFFGIAKYYAQI